MSPQRIVFLGFVVDCSMAFSGAKLTTVVCFLNTATTVGEQYKPPVACFGEYFGISG